MTDNQSENQPGKRTWIEEIEVRSEELVERVKQLAADNKVKRIRVVEPDGDIALEIPLNLWARSPVVPLSWPAPVLAILGAIGAFAAKLRIEIVNEVAEEEAPEENAEV